MKRVAAQCTDCLAGRTIHLDESEVSEARAICMELTRDIYTRRARMEVEHIAYAPQQLEKGTHADVIHYKLASEE